MEEVLVVGERMVRSVGGVVVEELVMEPVPRWRRCWGWGSGWCDP